MTKRSGQAASTALFWASDSLTDGGDKMCYSASVSTVNPLVWNFERETLLLLFQSSKLELRYFIVSGLVNIFSIINV